MLTIMKYCALILFFLMGYLLLNHVQQAQSATDSIDFEVSATCDPHSEIDFPAFVQLQYGFIGQAQGSAVDAFLKVGTENYEMNDFKFGLPEKGWVSVIFPGPSIQTKLYCQNLSDQKYFYLSADRFAHMKIYMSRDGSFSEEELASSQALQKTSLQVTGQGKYKNEFFFGRNTNNPYWLQFGLPLLGEVSFDGHLNVEVR